MPYKIVNDNGTLRSYAYWACFPVEYRVGEWTNRPDGCGPLATFSDLDAVKKFINMYMACGYLPHEYSENIFRLFECEIEPSEDQRLWTGPYHCMPPAGTLLADRVKLIKEVRYENTRLGHVRDCSCSICRQQKAGPAPYAGRGSDRHTDG